ncbi:hypothetical protein WJX84_001573 [Apatococcus fuscideae]
MPAIRGRCDVIGAAQTGSGKTLAFGLPILQLIMQQRGGGTAEAVPLLGGDACAEAPPAPAHHKSGPLRALILAPTRELALQVCNHMEAIAKPAGVAVVPILGGMAVQKQSRLLSYRPPVVVATPGRLWELMRDGQEHLTDLAGLSFLVLDEADRMLQQGHFQELSSILDHIAASRKQAIAEAAGTVSDDEEFAQLQAEDAADASAAEAADHDEARDSLDIQQDEASVIPDDALDEAGCPKFLQIFVFSATLTLPRNLRRRLKGGKGGASGSASLEKLMDKLPFRPKPKIVDLTSKRKLADKVTEAQVMCSDNGRDAALYFLLACHPGRTLVFVNAVSALRRLVALLKLLQLPVRPLHAGLQQRQRLKALQQFRSNPQSILVASDVAARGLDIPDVACVVHYQLPASADMYVHRCGRTARAAAEGIALALVTPKESARFSSLRKALGPPEPPSFPLDHHVMPAISQRMSLALQLDAHLRKESKAEQEASWKQRTAAELDLNVSDSDEPDPREASGRSRADPRAVAKLQQELAEKLAEPLQQRISTKFFTGAMALQTAASQATSEQHMPPPAAAAVPAHTELAQQLAEARQAAAASMQQRQASQTKRVKKARRQRQLDPRAAAEQAALDKALQKRRGGAGSRRGGLVVVPAAIGRQTAGPNALQALRQHMSR